MKRILINFKNICNIKIKMNKKTIIKLKMKKIILMININLNKIRFSI